jgi:hypothetical protein
MKRCWCNPKTHWSNDRNWWNDKNHIKEGATIDYKTTTPTSMIILIRFRIFTNIYTMRQKKLSILEDGSKDSGKKKN